MLVAGEPIFDAFEDLQRDGELTVRFRAGFWLRSDLPSASSCGPRPPNAVATHGALFQSRAVKLFADGVIEGHTAFLDEPYADTPGDRGFPEWSAAALECGLGGGRRRGVRAPLPRDRRRRHGDGARRHRRRSRRRPPGGRPAITHVQLTRRGDIERFADLGVTAVLNPYWFLKDDYFYDLQVPYLGAERAEHEYPMSSFFVAGVPVAAASDFPVTVPPDPLVGIQVGVMRWLDEAAAPGDVLWPEERVTVTQMIDSFTIDGARAHGLDGRDRVDRGRQVGRPHRAGHEHPASCRPMRSARPTSCSPSSVVRRSTAPRGSRVGDRPSGVRRPIRADPSRSGWRERAGLLLARAAPGGVTASGRSCLGTLRSSP